MERRTRQECARFGEALPPDLVDPPRLRLGLALFLNAWFDLDYERNSYEYQPIKRSDCFSYAYDYDFDEVQTEDLWYYVARMDRGFLKWRKDTEPKQDLPTTGKSGGWRS